LKLKKEAKNHEAEQQAYRADCQGDGRPTTCQMVGLQLGTVFPEMPSQESTEEVPTVRRYTECPLCGAIVPIPEIQELGYCQVCQFLIGALLGK
jgi:ribosomal protein S14